MRIEEHQVGGLIKDWLTEHPEYCGVDDGLIFDDVRHPYLNTDYDPPRWDVVACDDKAIYLVCTDLTGDHAGEVRIEYQGSRTYRNYGDHRRAIIMAHGGYGYDEARKGLAEGKYDVFTKKEWEDVQPDCIHAERVGYITGEYVVVTYWV